MLSRKKAPLSNFINNLIALLKFLLGLFLGGILFTWIITITETEAYIPFYDAMNNFFTNICYVFYAPTNSEEENFNALMYLAIATVFLLLVFDTISDIVSDIVKICESNIEQATAAENARVNQQMQKKYKMHLKTSMRFVLKFKLAFVNPMLENQAFRDEKIEQEWATRTENMRKEIFSLITSNIKCKMNMADNEMITFMVDSGEALNKAIFFIQSLCKVEKYVQDGLLYYMAVTTYLVTDSSEKALLEAQKLIDMKVSGKTLCYQVVSECLNCVADNNFRAVSNGEYAQDDNTIYELVNKN